MQSTTDYIDYSIETQPLATLTGALTVAPNDICERRRHNKRMSLRENFSEKKE